MVSPPIVVSQIVSPRFVLSLRDPRPLSFRKAPPLPNLVFCNILLRCLLALCRFAKCLPTLCRFAKGPPALCRFAEGPPAICRFAEGPTILPIHSVSLPPVHPRIEAVDGKNKRNKLKIIICDVVAAEKRTSDTRTRNSSFALQGVGQRWGF